MIQLSVGSAASSPVENAGAAMIGPAGAAAVEPVEPPAAAAVTVFVPLGVA